jgi:hypothetical protein
VFQRNNRAANMVSNHRRSIVFNLQNLAFNNLKWVVISLIFAKYDILFSIVESYYAILDRFLPDKNHVDMNICILYSGLVFNILHWDILYWFFSAELYDRPGKWRRSINCVLNLSLSTERETWTRGLEKTI